MTHFRRGWAALAGSLLATGWGSAVSAHPASDMAQHRVIIDSTNYQSVQQLLANTQVMVVARVESVTDDRFASQPASLVELKVHDVLRGHVGEGPLVAKPRSAGRQASQVVQVPLRRGQTYLLLLARGPGAEASSWSAAAPGSSRITATPSDSRNWTLRPRGRTLTFRSRWRRPGPRPCPSRPGQAGSTRAAPPALTRSRGRVWRTTLG
jgi:hypothetical protein